MKKSNEENISTKGSSEMGNDVDVILQPSSVCIPFLSLKDKDGENCEMQLCPDRKTRQEAKQCSNKIISRERQELFESFRSRNLHLLKYSSGDYYSPPVNMKIVNKQNVSLDARMKTDIIICDCIKQGDKYGMYASEPSNQCLPFESIKDIDNSEFEEAQLAQEIQEIKKAKVRKNLFNFEDDLQLASVQQRKPKHNAVYLSHNVLTGKKKGSKQDTSKQSSCEMETVISSSNKSSSSHLQTTDDERNKTHQGMMFTKYIAVLYPPGSRIHSLALNRWDDKGLLEAQRPFKGLVHYETVQESDLICACCKVEKHKVSQYSCNYSVPVKKHVILFKLPQGIESRFDQNKVALFLKANTEINNKHIAILCSDLHETKNVSLHPVMKQLCLCALKSYLFPADIVRFLWISDLQRKAFDLLKDHNISLMFPSLAYLRRYHAILILGEDASHLLRHQQTCFLHSIASVLNIHLNEILVLHSTEPNCHLKAFDKNG